MNKFNSGGSGYEFELGLSNSFSKSHYAVTNFSTSRKLIYNFLLVSNTNLPPILQRFRVMVKFSLSTGECLNLTPSLGVIPCQYRRKWYITKTWFFGLHFCCKKYRCIFNHFYVIRHESYRIRLYYAEVRAFTPFKVIQGRQFWYQSAHMRFICSSYATSY